MITINHNDIRKALTNYKKCNDMITGYELIRVMRNDINILGGITIEELYNDRIAFNKLVRLAETI